ncbi:pyridoxal phosphate-dependent aminotransferase [Acidimangrovimonas sediminis]|uniref:pyridoxal phosphate-dependent aminotransferase n=1 Tax=Acidimangrovimonas sediminis TaxID=2056283 RepID=UPI000C801219|nr:aminotransferase class I/II-fold pyridoxal phosphate-dependent enzyme [Acidimangrovimonas sediminis]
MKIANRIGHITQGAGDGWEIYYRTREMIAAGERVLTLTIGEHDIRTDPSILNAMHDSAMAGNTGYAFGPGNRDLREEVAARVAARTGAETSWRNVVITPGGQAALFATHMALLDQGDRALHCDPYYATYPGTIRATGADAAVVATRSSEDFLPQERAIHDAVAADPRGAKTLLINTPNNPTGVIYPRATLEGIARAVTDADLWLISDEVYDSQVWQGEHLSPRALPGMAGRTIAVGSMSKSHAMTGSRLGWVVAPEPVAEAIATLATNTTYGVPAFIQDAALFALRQGPAFEEKIAAPFRRRREIAMRVLTGHNAIRVIPSSGAMYVMLDIRATGLTGTGFANRLLDEEKIAVMPGESFGAASAGHVRVALTIADDLFEEAIGRLASFADRQMDA